MPVIEVEVEKLKSLIDKELSKEELEEIFFNYGLELSIDDDKAIIEITHDRMDLLSIYTLARAIRLYLNKEIPSNIKISDSNIEVLVDPSVSGIRPFIACFVAKNARLNEDVLKDLINLQEKLHLSFGGNRKLASIGLYNLDLINTPITYTTMNPNEIKFIPLNKNEVMNANEILERHETGIKYRHLLIGHEKYPVLIDAKNKILSLPPIINSNDLGRVKEDTKNILVEVTGTLSSRVNQFVNVLSYVFSTIGADVYNVKINYLEKNEKVTLPNSKRIEKRISKKSIKSILGLDLDETTIEKLLYKMDYELYESNNEFIKVGVPYYRVDILHEIDIIGDILKAYGLNKLDPIFPRTYVTGSLLDKTKAVNEIRNLMIGLGFNEVFTSSLSNEDVQYKKMNISNYDPIKLIDAKSSEMNIIRESIIPEMLKLISVNSHLALPIKIFEINDVVIRSRESDTGYKNSKRLAAVIYNSKTSFTDMKQVLDYILDKLDLDYRLDEITHPSFIDGRVGGISIDGNAIGIIGEINPQVIENFGLKAPLVAMELNIELIINKLIERSKVFSN